MENHIGQPSAKDLLGNILVLNEALKNHEGRIVKLEEVLAILSKGDVT